MPRIKAMKLKWILSFTASLLLVFASSDGYPGEPGKVELGQPPLYQGPELSVKAIESPAAGMLAATSVPSRSTVVDLYENEYLASLSVPIGWTGSVNGCVAGTTSTAYRNATMDMVNYFRVMTGLPVVSNLGSKNDEAQEAALMMDAANSLSHTPAADWPCYTAAGDEGAGSSNLALGAAGARAIDLYMEDPGTFNNHVGHRRWILYPRQTAMATGSTTSANALYVLALSTWGTRPASPSIVAWPPAGYVPYQVVFPRWSFSLNSAPGADYTNATVSLTQDGVSRDADIVSRTRTGLGDNTLVFVPSNISFGSGMEDSKVTVTVGKIKGADTNTVKYTITIIDPAMASGDIFSSSFEGGNP